MPALKRGDWAPSSLRKHLFGDEPYAIEQLCQLMMESDGEYSSMLISDRLLTAFEKLDHDGLIKFFQLLNTDYDLDPEVLGAVVKEYSEDPSAKILRKLTTAAESRRQELFRRLNLAPGGTRRLVKMREELLGLTRDYPELSKANIDFRHLFNSWFNRGFLTMVPVDWTTPAHILEKIIAYEAVHEIGNWSELRSRLEPEDRHCFAFFHPAMEDEPLVFVEVALTEKIPQKIEEILGAERDKIEAEGADTATFYSISNCHSGLAGVSFGNFLIKQVATSLKQKFPQLKKFATISPVPGFKGWLLQQADQHPEISSLLEGFGQDSEDSAAAHNDNLIAGLAAQYFLEQKTSRNEPIDPVARFHLKNGASLERLNLAADLSPKGLEQSLGLMVNYVYDLSKVEENHENYMTHHKVICSNQIKKLLPN